MHARHALVAALSVLLTHAVAAAPMYAVRDLGAFSTDANDTVQGLNAAGDVLLHEVPFDGSAQHCVVVSADGSKALVAVPGTPYMSCAAITDDRTVVGYWQDPQTMQSHAMTWRAGVVTTLPDASVAGSAATAMNASGHLAGYVYHDDGVVRAMAGKEGRWYPVLRQDQPGVPVAIDRHGAVAGNLVRPGLWPMNAFVRRQGVTTVYGDVHQDLSLSTWVTAMDDRGHLAGGRMAPDRSHSDAVIMDPDGSMRSVALDGWVTSVASGINDAGIVVGNAIVADQSSQPFVHDGLATTELRSHLVDTDRGTWRLENAYSVNASGVVACTAYTPVGERHLVLLVPQQGR